VVSYSALVFPLGVLVPVITYIFINEEFNKTLLSFLMDISIKTQWILTHPRKLIMRH
jgi:hypothetical protein